jgi:hypothetical protein
VELLITAQSNAVPVLEAHTAAMNRLNAAVKAGTPEAIRFREELQKGTKVSADLVAVYGGAAAATTKLGEATQGASSRMASFTAAMSALSGGISTVSLAAGLLGGVLVGNLLAAYEKIIASQREFQRALQDTDWAKINAGVEEYSNKIKVLGDNLERAERVKKSLDVVLSPDVTGEARGFSDIMSGYFSRQRDQAVDELRRRAILQSNSIYSNSLTEGEAGVLSITNAQDAARIAALRGQRGGYDFTLQDPALAQYRASVRSANDLRDLVGTGPAANAVVGGALSIAGAQYGEARRQLGLGFQAIPIHGIEDVARSEGLGAGVAMDRADVERVLNDLDKIAARFFVGREAGAEPGIAESALLEGGGIGDTEALNRGRIAVREADLREREKGRDLEVARLTIEQQRLDIVGQIYGLTQNQRDALETEISLGREQLEIAKLQAQIEAESDERRQKLLRSQQDLVQLQGAITRSAISQQNAERNDPVTGLAKGFRDAAEEAEASGKAMEALARNTARTMQQAFSDEFFAVITGDFKRLPDLAKQFGLAMVRNITDTFAQMATAPLLRSVANALGTSGGGGLRAVAGIGAGAGAVATTAGTAYALPGVSFGSSVFSQHGITGAASTAAASSPGIGGLVGGLPIGPLMDLLAGSTTASLGAGAAVTAADVALLSSYGYSAADIAGVAALAGPASITTTAGITLGEALGAVGAVVGFGLSLYGAYQSGSPVSGAIQGGISGAAAGFVIGTIFPGIGNIVGAVVGLVAGAALGAGAGALGKPNPKTHAQREQQEAKNASNSVTGAPAEIANTATFEQLYAVILKYSHRSFGGGKESVSPETAGFAVSFVHPDTGSRMIVGKGRGFAGPNDLRRLGFEGDLSTIKARIQAGISETMISQIGAPVEQAIVTKIQRLAAIESKAYFAFRQRFAAPGVAAGGGNSAVYERETFLPLSRAGEAVGQNIEVNREILTAAGMTDNEIEAFLRELARVDADRMLGYINADRFSV